MSRCFSALEQFHLVWVKRWLMTFNWHFSEHLNTPDLVKRLVEIATATKHSVIIFADSLEEATAESFPQSVSELAMHLSAFAGKVRLIVTLKAQEWPRFAQFRGTPSALATSLDTSWYEHEPSDKNPRPLVLTEFSEQELSVAEGKYARLFGLSNVPSGLLRKHCRLPYFLRLVSEVYAGRSLPSDISESQLVREWLARKLASMPNPERSRLELNAMAKAAYVRATKEERTSTVTPVSLQQVSEADILQQLQSSTHSINDLVSGGVVLRHTDEHARVAFSFYYSRVRDYLIATQVLQLDKMTLEQFSAVVETLLSSYVLQGVLAWHVREAPPSHVVELRKVLRGRALLYIETYNRIFVEVAPGAKAGVEPFTTGAWAWHTIRDPTGRLPCIQPDLTLS
jgi:hypothetical protein